MEKSEEWAKPKWLEGWEYMWGELTPDQEEVVKKNRDAWDEYLKDGKGIIRRVLEESREHRKP